MSTSSSFFILAALVHDALAQNYGYQGYGAPAPWLSPVTPSIYASDVAADSLSSSATYASATKYLTTDDFSSSIPSVASANTISAYSDFNITAIIASATRYWNTTDGSSVAVAPTGYASSSVYISLAPQSSTSLSSGAYDTSRSSTISQASSVESSRPYGAFLPFPMSSIGYYPTTSKYIPTATSLASFGPVPASLVMPTNSANASTTTNCSSTNALSESAYVVPSVVTSSAPPLNYAGETMTSSFGCPPFSNSTKITQYSGQSTASQYNITAIIASATAYWNTTNLSTGVSIQTSSLAAGVGTSTIGSGYSSIAVPLSSPVAPYGFTNSSIAAPTAGSSLGSVGILTTLSSATSTVNVPITLTVIPVAANTSLATRISSDVPAAISLALSQITANASAALPTNITAGLSSAIAHITSLAGYGTSSTLAGPETFNSSNTLPPESVLAGISSAVAQITSLAGMTSAASESDDFESATPPSAQSTVNAVDASATSPGQGIVSTMATASITGLAYTSESLSSAATSASVSIMPSAPAYGYGGLPSTLITHTVTATTQVSARLSAQPVIKIADLQNFYLGRLGSSRMPSRKARNRRDGEEMEEKNLVVAHRFDEIL